MGGGGHRSSGRGGRWRGQGGRGGGSVARGLGPRSAARRHVLTPGRRTATDGSDDWAGSDDSDDSNASDDSDDSDDRMTLRGAAAVSAPALG